MAITSFRVSVVDTPTLLVRGGSRVSYLTAKNAHASAACCLGGSLVTFAGGFSLGNGDVSNITVAPGEEVYAVADTGITVPVHVIHQASR